jgi:hypothetical protein
MGAAGAFCAAAGIAATKNPMLAIAAISLDIDLPPFRYVALLRPRVMRVVAGDVKELDLAILGVIDIGMRRQVIRRM